MDDTRRKKKENYILAEDIAIEGNPIWVPTVDSDVEFELEPDDDDYKELNFNED